MIFDHYENVFLIGLLQIKCLKLDGVLFSNDDTDLGIVHVTDIVTFFLNHSFLYGCNPPPPFSEGTSLSGYPLFLNQIKKVTPPLSLSLSESHPNWCT